MRIQLEQLGQLLVAAAAELQGFQASLQTALWLVQQAREKDQRSLPLLRGDLGGSAPRNFRERLAGQDLAPSHGRVLGAVQKQSRDLLPGNAMLLASLQQRIFNLNVQDLPQFIREVALGSAVD